MAIPSQENNSPSSSTTGLSTKNDDCYFYYYSSCNKGNQCAFRHEPAALCNETMCRFWLQGHCSKPKCIFRHMEIDQPRNKVPCYFESKPGGCKKVHCAFLHNNILDQPREEDRAKNPDIILPLAGSQSPSDDGGYQRQSSSVYQSRSSSRSPDFLLLPPRHPAVIVTTSDLESEDEGSVSPRKRWMPRPVYTEVAQDPILTREREEELNMLRKVQEEQAELIGYIFVRDNDEELGSLTNGGQSSQVLPTFVDEIEEFDVSIEDLESLLPAGDSGTTGIATHSSSNNNNNNNNNTIIKADTVSRIATVIGNRVDSNKVKPMAVKTLPTPPNFDDYHHPKGAAVTGSPASHRPDRIETRTVSSSHHQHSSAMSSSSPNSAVSRHLSSQLGSGGKSNTETTDVLRPGGGNRRLRRKGLAGIIIADVLGSSNSSPKYHESSKRIRDGRDLCVQSMDYRSRHSKNSSLDRHHREGSFHDGCNRSDDRNDRYPGSARRDSLSKSTYSSRKRSLPRDGTPERNVKKQLVSDFHSRSEHHLNTSSNGIVKSSLISSVNSNSRQNREERDGRFCRNISLHERFSTSDGSDLPAEIKITTSGNDCRPARISSLKSRDKEHSRSRENSSSRSVRTRIAFPNSCSSRDRSRSRSPERRPHPAGEIKIKSLSEIRQEKASKLASQTNDPKKIECRKPSGIKRKRSPISFQESEDNSSNSRSLSIKKARLHPEADPFVPSGHCRSFDLSKMKSFHGSHDSITKNNNKISAESKSNRSVDSNHRHIRIVENLECGETLTSSSFSNRATSSTLPQDTMSSKNLKEEEEELLLMHDDEVDYEVDDINEMDLLLL